MSQGSAKGATGTDATAIHDDTAGEINAITLKGTPVDADEFVIEDSAAGGAKKSATLGTLPAHTPAAHTILSHDTDTTGAELTELADASETTLHSHAAAAAGPLDDASDVTAHVPTKGNLLVGAGDIEVS